MPALGRFLGNCRLDTKGELQKDNMQAVATSEVAAKQLIAKLAGAITRNRQVKYCENKDVNLISNSRVTCL